MKRTIRFFALLLSACLLLSVLVACGNGDDTTTKLYDPSNPTAYIGRTVKAYAINGPTGISMASLMAKRTQTQFNYEFTLMDKPDKVVPEIVKGNYDIAALPTNLAATLYQKTKGELQVIAVNTLGVLSVLENGNSISTVADLAGKTIYYFGQASTPQYIIENILRKNNISATLIPVAEAAELATLMAAGTHAVGILPEPNVSVALSKATQQGNSALRIALDLTETWKDCSDNKAPLQGCIVARRAFLNEIGPIGLQALLSELKASADFVKEDITVSAPVIVAQGIISSEPLAKKAITNLGDSLCFITGATMKLQLEAFFTILYTANPASIGGAMPDGYFYTLAS